MGKETIIYEKYAAQEGFQKFKFVVEIEGSNSTNVRQM